MSLPLRSSVQARTVAPSPRAVVPRVSLATRSIVSLLVAAAAACSQSTVAPADDAAATPDGASSDVPTSDADMPDLEGDESPVPSPVDGGPVDGGGEDADLPPPADAGPPPAECGDGILATPEECEDGNTSVGDGCDDDCRVEADACPGGTAPTALRPGVTVRGDTAGRMSAATSSCGGNASGEAAHFFTLYIESDVTIRTDLPGTDFDTAVYVRRDCASRASEIGCAAAGPLGDTITLEALPAGTYFVFVDGVGGASGTYAVEMTARPRIAEGGACDAMSETDACARGTECFEGQCLRPTAICERSATALRLGATVVGSTAGAEDRYDAICSTDGASPERVFSVTVPEGAYDLVVEATPTDFPADGFDPILSVLSECGVLASTRGCADASRGGPETVTVRDVPAGTYYVSVDGFQSARGTPSAGEFTLRARLRRVVGLGETCDPMGVDDRCARDLRCTPGSGGVATCVDPFAVICASATPVMPGVPVSGTLTSGTSRLAPICATTSTPEAIYAVDLAEPAVLSARVRGTVGGNTTVYVRGAGSCGPSDDLACDTTSGSRLEAVTDELPPGRYYAVVDGTGTYTLTVTSTRILREGEACDGASSTAICGGGTRCLGGRCAPVDVIADRSPNAAFCDAQGPATRDTVFVGELTVGGATDVDTVAIHLASAGVITLSTSDGRGGCAADTLVEIFDGTMRGCAELDAAMPVPLASDDDGGFGTCSRLTTARLPPGTYYVRVRRPRAGAAGGPYELWIDLP
jgi:cysteine-rich repeat protein